MLPAERETQLRVITPAIMDEFAEHKNKWKQDVLSDSSSSVDSPAFRKIISMGELVLPLVLEELRVERGEKSLSWFFLLEVMTGENPVEETGADNVEDMHRSWLKWGEDKGYIKPRIELDRDRIESERKAVAIVERNGKVLVGQGRNGFSIPEVLVGEDETDEQALQREVREKLGLHIKACSLLAKGNNATYYLCSPDDSREPLTKKQGESQPVFVASGDIVEFSNLAIELPPGVVLHLTGA